MTTRFAMNAARRAANSLAWQLEDGLSSLAAIASVAALLGLLGSCWAIIAMFVAKPDFDKPFFVTIQGHVVTALWWNAFGLALAVATAAGYRMLRDRWHQLTTEMELVLLELPDVFFALGGAQWTPDPAPNGSVALAERAASRARRSVTGDFGRRIAGLGTVVSVAPFAGLFGTCLWIALPVAICDLSISLRRSRC